VNIPCRHWPINGIDVDTLNPILTHRPLLRHAIAYILLNLFETPANFNLGICQLMYGDLHVFAVLESLEATVQHGLLNPL